MKKRRNRSDSSAWMALPLYIFTIVFVVCPLIYMVALEFCYALQRIWGDLEIYAGQLQKYSGTCIPEHICGITEAGIYQYDSDRFDRLSVRVFHGEAAGAQKEKGTASVVYAVLGKFPDPSVWLDHYSAEKRTFELCIDETWDY